MDRSGRRLGVADEGGYWPQFNSNEEAVETLLDAIINTGLDPNHQVGTLSEAKAAFEAARARGWSTIISARSGETEDVTIVHLAMGWGVPQIKVGSFARSERMAKWNEVIRIELA